MKTEATPRPWLREDRTVYSLEHAGWRKGEELFQNRFYTGVQGGPNTSQEELEANARLIVRAVNNFEPLLEVLEIAKVRLGNFYSWDGGQRFCGHCKSSAAQPHMSFCPIFQVETAIANAKKEVP